MGYNYLLFKPYIRTDITPDTILWKAEIYSPANYQSVNLVMLSDNIAVNNRRPIKYWEQLLTDNGFKFHLNFENEYSREYVIFDTELVTFTIHFYACDVSVGNNNVEIDEDLSLSLLYILDLNKSGKISPHNLINKINNAEELLVSNTHAEYLNKTVVNVLMVLERLANHCISYECDISYGILASEKGV
jgi:hypothetical protein